MISVDICSLDGELIMQPSQHLPVSTVALGHIFAHLVRFLCFVDSCVTATLECRVSGPRWIDRRGAYLVASN